jgi:hypothetical protein
MVRRGKNKLISNKPKESAVYALPATPTQRIEQRESIATVEQERSILPMKKRGQNTSYKIRRQFLISSQIRSCTRDARPQKWDRIESSRGRPRGGAKRIKLNNDGTKMDDAERHPAGKK